MLALTATYIFPEVVYWFIFILLQPQHDVSIIISIMVLDTTSSCKFARTCYLGNWCVLNIRQPPLPVTLYSVSRFYSFLLPLVGCDCYFFCICHSLLIRFFFPFASVCACLYACVLRGFYSKGIMCNNVYNKTESSDDVLPSRYAVCLKSYYN